MAKLIDNEKKPSSTGKMDYKIIASKVLLYLYSGRNEFFIFLNEAKIMRVLFRFNALTH